MIKINKITFIILFYSFAICQDYSLMDIYWEPEFPDKGDDITIYGNGEQTRSFCYVDDLLDSCYRMLTTSASSLDSCSDRIITLAW